MLLKDLTGDAALAATELETEIAGLSADSRTVSEGYLFAALKGAHADGSRFIEEACGAGAGAVLVSSDTPYDVLGPASSRCPVIVSDDPRRTLALMAARFHEVQPGTLVAVTGTSGKTSVTVFARQIFAHAGFEAASLGTIGTVTSRGAHYGGLTTPDPVTLHKTLAELARDGITHAALEASSHGLDQRRLDGLQLAAAAFTNLGRDHLDYHKDVGEYLQAKLRLIDTLLEPGRPVVVEPSAPYADAVMEVARACGHPLFTVGEGGANLALLDIRHDGFHQVLSLDTAEGTREVRLPLAGRFQVSNALIAAGLAISVGVETDSALAALEHLEGAPGRLELVGETDDGALVFVDYAHKPDALDTALAALRPFTRGRLIVVFGAGGDRDAGKRPLMGEAASRQADVVIVTDDNPRGEDPATIRAAILAAAPGALEIADRHAAIEAAVGMLQSGDVLCIAGKGHETGQIVGAMTLPFSDHDVARAAIESAAEAALFAASSEDSGDRDLVFDLEGALGLEPLAGDDVEDRVLAALPPAGNLLEEQDTPVSSQMASNAGDDLEAVLAGLMQDDLAGGREFPGHLNDEGNQAEDDDLFAGEMPDDERRELPGGALAGADEAEVKTPATGLSEEEALDALLEGIARDEGPFADDVDASAASDASVEEDMTGEIGVPVDLADDDLLGDLDFARESSLPDGEEASFAGLDEAGEATMAGDAPVSGDHDQGEGHDTDAAVEDTPRWSPDEADANEADFEPEPVPLVVAAASPFVAAAGAAAASALGASVAGIAGEPEPQADPDRPLWTLADMIAATGGEAVNCDREEIGGLSIDSRTLQPGDAFVAIAGERFDGHQFARAAIEAGAALAIVARDKMPELPAGGRYLVVADPLAALNDLARAARARSRARIVAVTGSVGKTSTKDMLKLALDRSGPTHAPVASFNNHWGVPLTLARMPVATRFGIFEIGMNHPGEITPLVKLVRPHVVIITTVGPVHLEFFGSVERIAQAKSEIFLGLEPGGLALLNRDNDQFDLLTYLAKTAGVQRLATFGRAGSADAQAVQISAQTGCTSISGHIFDHEIAYKIGAPGQHLVTNSLAVLAAVAELGGDLALAGLALADFHAPKGRGAQLKLKLRSGEATLIDESYNANPSSMRAALRLLGETPTGPRGRRIAVLGDMLELGEATAQLHAGLFGPVRDSKADIVFCAGAAMHALWDVLPKHLRGAYAEEAASLRPLLFEELRPGDVIMIKGSLGTRMGPLVDALRREFPADEDGAE